ncbi:MAG: spermidine/putrescine ABC transporter substrate-binding protein [Lachnospiraceae bacterium]|jgi:spermidine/putrescine transport system substrate-binding protein|nr:spermidine/putrescine ABC transporter substrate-binding protein [Lachnospiraceae bacterium]
MKRNIIALFVTAVLLTTLFSGCGKKESGEKLYLYNWTEYIPQEVYDAFEEETGIKVIESTFSSNEEMLAKLTAGGSDQYDLVMASNYVVEAMIKQELIQPIHKEKLENLGNISSTAMNQDFDPDNQYSIPFMSTITVIAVNREKCKDLGIEIHTFNDLLNPALENNIVAVDDVREIVGIALKAQGQDSNTCDQAVVEASLSWLLELQPNIKAYDSDSPKTLLAANDVAVGIVYNTDAGMAIKENPDIDVIFTEEPCQISMDNYVMSANAKNVENAEKFLDFIHRPEIYKMMLDEFPSVCLNDAALAIMDGEYLDNPGSNVDASEIARATLIEEVGDAVVWYDEVFTKMKTN